MVEVSAVSLLTANGAPNFSLFELEMFESLKESVFPPYRPGELCYSFGFELLLLTLMARLTLCVLKFEILLHTAGTQHRNSPEGRREHHLLQSSRTEEQLLLVAVHTLTIYVLESDALLFSCLTRIT